MDTEGQDLLSTQPLNIAFAVLEIFLVPPNYQTYPCKAQHHILINLIKYGTPDFLVWDAERYNEQIIPMKLDDRIKQWTAF